MLISVVLIRSLEGFQRGYLLLACVMFNAIQSPLYFLLLNKF